MKVKLVKKWKYTAEAVVYKKSVYKNFTKFTGQNSTPVLKSLFNKVVDFAKFIKNTLLKNITG